MQVTNEPQRLVIQGAAFGVVLRGPNQCQPILRSHVDERIQDPFPKDHVQDSGDHH